MPSTSVFFVSGDVDVLSERRRKRKHRWHVLEFIPSIRFCNTLQTPYNLYIEVTRGWNRRISFGKMTTKKSYRDRTSVQLRCQFPMRFQPPSWFPSFIHPLKHCSLPSVFNIPLSCCFYIYIFPLGLFSV